jgi:hypothetical protein
MKIIDKSLLLFQEKEVKKPIDIKEKANNDYFFINEVSNNLYSIITERMKQEHILKLYKNIVFNESNKNSFLQLTIEAIDVFQIFLTKHQGNENYYYVKNRLIDYLNKHQSKLNEYFLPKDLPFDIFNFFMNSKKIYGKKEQQEIENKILYDELMAVNFNTKIINDLLQYKRTDINSKDYLVLHDFVDYCNYRSQIISKLQDIIIIIS